MVPSLINKIENHIQRKKEKHDEGKTFGSLGPGLFC